MSSITWSKVEKTPSKDWENQLDTKGIWSRTNDLASTRRSHKAWAGNNNPGICRDLDESCARSPWPRSLRSAGSIRTGYRKPNSRCLPSIRFRGRVVSPLLTRLVWLIGAAHDSLSLSPAVVVCGLTALNLSDNVLSIFHPWPSKC